MLALNTILHPTDFSPQSEYAFRLACSLARDHGAKVVVLHVVTPPPAVSYGELLDVDTASQVEHFWDMLRQIKSPDTTIQVEQRLEEGFTATEILRVAEEVECDLIVLGTHGRSGMSRLLMGSVAEQVVRKAKCPVLAVKGPVAEAAVTAEAPVYAVAEDIR